MIRTLTFVLLLFSSFNVVLSQRFGLQAGLSMNRFKGSETEFHTPNEDYTEKFKWSAGILLGGVFDYELNYYYGLRIGLFLSTRGTQLESKYNLRDVNYDLEETEELKITNASLEIPVGFKGGKYFGNFKLYGSIDFVSSFMYSSAGLYSLTTRETINGITTETDQSDSGEFAIGSKSPDVFSLFNIGLQPGIGVQYYQMLIEINYYNGLNDMWVFDESTMKQRSMTLTFTYLFGTGKYN